MGAESTMPLAAQGWANQKAKEEINLGVQCHP